MEVVLGLWIVTAFTCAVIGAFIGADKGRLQSGAIIGLLLGPFGVIVAALLPATVEVAARRQALIEQKLQSLRQAAPARTAEQMKSLAKSEPRAQLKREIEATRAKLEELEREETRREEEAQKTAAIRAANERAIQEHAQRVRDAEEEMKSQKARKAAASSAANEAASAVQVYRVQDVDEESKVQEAQKTAAIRAANERAIKEHAQEHAQRVQDAEKETKIQADALANLASFADWRQNGQEPAT